MDTYRLIQAAAVTSPYQRGHDAARRSGEYLGIDHLADDPMAHCPYPDDTAESIDWMDGYRDGARAMDEAWSRYD
jgi:hypothetical protein